MKATELQVADRRSEIEGMQNDIDSIEKRIQKLDEVKLKSSVRVLTKFIGGNANVISTAKHEDYKHAGSSIHAGCAEFFTVDIPLGVCLDHK